MPSGAAPAAAPVEMTASSVPTATVSSSLTLIDVSTPAVGAGISVSMRAFSIGNDLSASTAATAKNGK